MSSPTQRSLAYLRKNGWTCQIVEKYNIFTHRRIDLFNCIDIVCVKPGTNGILGIQTTTAVHKNDHLKKMMSIPEIQIFLECGNRLVLHTWGKRGKAGKRKLWILKETEIT